jgi:hypothetical protein
MSSYHQGFPVKLCEKYLPPFLKMGTFVGLLLSHTFDGMGLKATSKNVIPAKAGIQKRLTSLDSRLRGSDKLIIIRGSLNFLFF